MRIAFNKPTNVLPLYCDSIGYNWREQDMKRPNGYYTYHWLQTEAGSGTVSINGKSFTLSQNQGLLMRSRLPHSYHPNEGDTWMTSFLTFDGTLAEPITSLFGLKDYVLLPKLAPELATFISKYFDTFVNKDLISLNEQSVNIYRFLTLIHENELYARRTTFHDQEIVSKIIQYINQHYPERITNATLSEVTRYTTAYQNRIFNKIYNQTPLEYLDDYRMQKAKEFLLTKPDWEVNKVAYEIGFGTSSQFIFHFRKYYGITPEQFRKNF